MRLFDGKVVVITGAGGGLGEAYAYEFAKEGAKVVVNDLGGASDGAGEGGAAMARRVVDRITEMGSEAVASCDSVCTEEGADNIVKTAVDTFGRLDVLVNNAGILRDKTLLMTTRDLWDPVIEVHLLGTFLMARAAAQQMVDQGEGGRIINTTSLAGMIGNYGQCNYSAAKAGIAGFTRTIALELRRFGITVNAVAPLAKTRLTDGIDAVPEWATSDCVAPIVLFLASELAAGVTGRIFGAHINHLFEYRTEMTTGVNKDDVKWEVSEIAERFDQICRSEAEVLREERKREPAMAVESVTPPIKALKVLEATATAFMPDKAGDWRAVLHFQVAGCGALTMEIASGQVSVERGTAGEATCVIEMDADTFFGIAEGRVDGMQAFMQGRLSATNLEDMVKYSTCFHQSRARTAVAEVLAGLR